jgi:hypothetical protein
MGLVIGPLSLLRDRSARVWLGPGGSTSPAVCSVSLLIFVLWLTIGCISLPVPAFSLRSPISRFNILLLLNLGCHAFFVS